MLSPAPTHAVKVSQRLALAFCAGVRTHLSAQELRDVNRANRRPDYADSCATHDYIDANETMEIAFVTVVGRGSLVSSAADTALINMAWDTAKASGFRLGLSTNDEE